MAVAVASSRSSHYVFGALQKTTDLTFTILNVRVVEVLNFTYLPNGTISSATVIVHSKSPNNYYQVIFEGGCSLPSYSYFVKYDGIEVTTASVANDRKAHGLSYEVEYRRDRPRAVFGCLGADTKRAQPSLTQSKLDCNIPAIIRLFACANIIGNWKHDQDLLDCLFDVTVEKQKFIAANKDIAHPLDSHKYVAPLAHPFYKAIMELLVVAEKRGKSPIPASDRISSQAQQPPASKRSKTSLDGDSIVGLFSTYPWLQEKTVLFKLRRMKVCLESHLTNLGQILKIDSVVLPMDAPTHKFHDLYVRFLRYWNPETASKYIRLYCLSENALQDGGFLDTLNHAPSALLFDGTLTPEAYLIACTDNQKLGYARKDSSVYLYNAGCTNDQLKQRCKDATKYIRSCDPDGPEFMHITFIKEAVRLYISVTTTRNIAYLTFFSFQDSEHLRWLFARLVFAPKDLHTHPTSLVNKEGIKRPEELNLAHYLIPITTSVPIASLPSMIQFFHSEDVNAMLYLGRMLTPLLRRATPRYPNPPNRPLIGISYDTICGTTEEASKYPAQHYSPVSPQKINAAYLNNKPAGPVSLAQDPAYHAYAALCMSIPVDGLITIARCNSTSSEVESLIANKFYATVTTRDVEPHTTATSFKKALVSGLKSCKRRWVASGCETGGRLPYLVLHMVNEWNAVAFKAVMALLFDPEEIKRIDPTVIDLSEIAPCTTTGLGIPIRVVVTLNDVPLCHIPEGSRAGHVNHERFNFRSIFAGASILCIDWFLDLLPLQ